MFWLKAAESSAARPNKTKGIFRDEECSKCTHIYYKYNRNTQQHPYYEKTAEDESRVLLNWLHIKEKQKVICFTPQLLLAAALLFFFPSPGILSIGAIKQLIMKRPDSAEMKCK